MLERRRHDRTRDFAVATISAGAQPATIDCVVRNLSAGGALLLLDEPRRAPVEMHVAVRGGSRPARIVWRGATGVGVAFATRGPAPEIEPRPAMVVCLDAARLDRARGGEGRLAERIARFVRSSRPGLNG